MRHLQKSGIITLKALGGPIGSRTSPVQEGVSPKDMDKIKAAVEAATSFMNVGMHLKKAGLRYTFATSPMAIYIVQPTPNNRVAIVNKRYASDPDFVHGEIAVGIMESVNENTINEGISKDAIVRTLTSDKNAYYLSKDGNDWILDITPKAAQQSTFHQKFNVKDMGKGHLGMKYKLSETTLVNEGYTVRGDNPYQFTQGVYSVLSAYLRDEKLGSKEERMLKDVISSLEYLAKYFHSKRNESVNEGKKAFKVNPGIGKAKYSISSHDGVKKHKDGSDFWDIEIFKNKVDLEKAIKNYSSKGFVKEDIENVANGLPQTMGKEKSLKREALKSIVREVMQEEAEYQNFFQKVLDKAGKSIPSMSDDEKKAFFNKVDAAWKAKQEGK